MWEHLSFFSQEINDIHNNSLITIHHMHGQCYWVAIGNSRSRLQVYGSVGCHRILRRWEFGALGPTFSHSLVTTLFVIAILPTAEATLHSMTKKFACHTVTKHQVDLGLIKWCGVGISSESISCLQLLRTTCCIVHQSIYKFKDKKTYMHGDKRLTATFH
jgi:hypothetical protein